MIAFENDVANLANNIFYRGSFLNIDEKEDFIRV